VSLALASLSPMEAQHEIGRLQRENDLLREAVERLVDERRQRSDRRRLQGVDWLAALARTIRVRRSTSPPADCELCPLPIEGGDEYAFLGTHGSRKAHAECIRRQLGRTG
jgi:hypothetical protein